MSQEPASPIPQTSPTPAPEPLCECGPIACAFRAGCECPEWCAKLGFCGYETFRPAPPAQSSQPVAMGAEERAKRIVDLFKKPPGDWLEKELISALTAHAAEAVAGVAQERDELASALKRNTAWSDSDYNAQKKLREDALEQLAEARARARKYEDRYFSENAMLKDLTADHKAIEAERDALRAEVKRLKDAKYTNDSEYRIAAKDADELRAQLSALRQERDALATFIKKVVDTDKAAQAELTAMGIPLEPASFELSNEEAKLLAALKPEVKP